jgi:hypothetical protein
MTYKKQPNKIVLPGPPKKAKADSLDKYESTEGQEPLLAQHPVMAWPLVEPAA